MSFILDALRKSENRRRIGRTPDLTTDGGLPPARRRRRLWPLLAVLVAIAVVIGAGVWLLPHGRVLDGFNRLVSSPPAGSEVDETAPAEPSRAGETAAADESAGRRSASTEAEQSPQPPPEQRRRSRRERIPGRDDAVSRTVAETERQAETGQSDTDAEPSREQAGEAELAAVADRVESAMNEVEPAGETAAGEANSEPQEPGWRPEAAEYLRAWELPLSVRRDLPSLDLNIHVFSADPQARFVLINGERFAIGDELGGGAQLADIRREGAVIDFREHRFLLEP